MKKITFLFLMLLSITAFSQVEIVENFDTTPNNQVPAGWSHTGLQASTNFACGGSGKSAYGGIPQSQAGTSITMTTPNYTAISNGTDLSVSFSLNVFEQVSQFPPPSFVAPAANWGSVVVEYSTDGGNSWTTATTINDSNFTFVSTADCVSIPSVNVGPIAAGSDFQARFVATASNVSNFALLFFIDNISITQVATSVPNCDATLLSPTNGSNTADTDVTLTWQAATGIPTGYTVSVGTTSGGTDIVNAVTTTATSYPLTGLTYETDYYVNIIPFNGIGNATGCTEEMFTTRVAPITGATCSSPHEIASFPYIVPSDDTANYENNINTSPCNNSYMNGNDVFYRITPSSDVSINIDVTSISNNGASIHVVEGCPDSATNCVTYVGSYSGTSRNLSEVVLFAGNTYYVVLSNSSSSRTYSYSLIITENSCINPEFNLTPVSDCGNGQFTVDVDVTYMGDAASLTLTDDFGNSNNAVATTGVVNMGPYLSGSTVNFTLTSNDDGACSYTGSTYFYCPPSNDECVNAIDLTATINTDDTCTITTSATNAGATESMSDPASCGSGTNDVWFSFVADGDTMILEFLNVTAVPGTPSGGIIQSIELYEGTCGSLTSLGCPSVSISGYAQLSNLVDGNTYYIRNKPNLAGEYAQSYDICLKTAPAPPVNDECSNATTLTLSTDDQCNNAAMGTTVGATVSVENSCNTGIGIDYNDVWYVFTPTTTAFYEFSYETTGVNTTITRYFIYEGSCGSFTDVSTSCSTNNNQIVRLTSGQSYYVMVRTGQSGPGVDFNLCVWQLPPAVENTECSTPTTLLESTNSNGNNTITGNLDNAYYSPEGCSSSSYESVWYSFTPNYTGMYNFDFTRVSGYANYTIFDTDDCSNTGSAGYVTGSCYNSGDLTGDVVAGNTYLIMVHASSAAEFELFAYPDPSLSVESTVFDTFKYYPNPVVNTFTVEAKNSISSIHVYNLVGQQVMVANPNNLKTTIDMNDLKNGVYFVTVTINGAQKTIKVLKK